MAEQDRPRKISYCRFGWLSLKFTFTNLIGIVLWNLLGILAGMSGNNSEFASFGLLMDTTEFFYSVFFSVCYLKKMIIAHEIALKKTEET